MPPRWTWKRRWAQHGLPCETRSRLARKMMLNLPDQTGEPADGVSAGHRSCAAVHPNRVEAEPALLGCPAKSAQIMDEIIRGLNLTSEPCHVSDDLDDLRCEFICLPDLTVGVAVGPARQSCFI